MQCALVKDGKVIEIIDWDGGPRQFAPEGSTAVPLSSQQTASVGDLYDNGRFIAAPVPEPEPPPVEPPVEPPPTDPPPATEPPPTDTTTTSP